MITLRIHGEIAGALLRQLEGKPLPGDYVWIRALRQELEPLYREWLRTDTARMLREAQQDQAADFLDGAA